MDLVSYDFFSEVPFKYLEAKYWTYCRFLYAETQELKSGQKQKYFSYHICYENLAKVSKVNKQTDRTKQYASKEESIKSLNKVGTFAQDFKD